MNFSGRDRNVKVKTLVVCEAIVLLGNRLYETVFCLSCQTCLSVTLVYCGQTVGWIKMKLGMEVGLSPGHTVLDGDSTPPEGQSPQFLAHVYCGQTVAHLSYC